MHNQDKQRSIKAIKLLQSRSDDIESSHDDIGK